MMWTTDKPTTPGWYWWRHRHGWKADASWTVPKIVKVVNKAGLLMVCAWCQLGNMLDGEWAGPIPEPEERA